MPSNLPIQNYYSPPQVADSWVRPIDWITITDSPNEVQFLMSDINDANCTIRTSFTRLSGTQNITIDWGDGTTNVISSTTSTDTTHQYTVGAGTPCSLGYTTFKVRVYLTGTGTSTIDNCNIFSLLLAGNTSNHAQMCGVLEAYYGDNTQKATPINFFSLGSVSTSLSTYNYLSYVKCPDTVTWTNCDNIFRNCYNISKIVMPRIGNNITTLITSFTNCTSLVDLTFMTEASSITSLNNTFLNCQNLKTIILPTSLNSLTDLTATFTNCFKLLNLTFPSINSAFNFTGTFNGCSGLAWVKFTSLPTTTSNTISFSNAFNSCANLQTVYFPPTCNSSSVYDFTSTFFQLYQFKSIEFPSNMNFTSTGLNSAFQNSYSLVKCILPTTCPGLSSLQGTFSGCNNLTNVKLPSTAGPLFNLNTTFSQCLKLSKITIPNTLNVGNMFGTFGGCISLKTIDLSAQTSITSLSSTFSNCRLLSSITFPSTMNSVTTLISAFTNCINLTNITLPTSLNSVTSLQTTFSGCNNLLSVTLPSSMPACNTFSSTFTNCYRIKSITLPNTVSSLTTTYQSTFDGCTSLSSVTFPGSQQFSNVSNITSIFRNCADLTTITNFDKIGSSANSGNVTAASITNNKLISISFQGKLNSLDLSGTSTVKTDVQSVRLLNTNTGQWGTSGPNVSYTNMSTANLIQLFNDLAAQGSVVSKTINITGATGAAGLSAANRQIITNIGWTITG